MYLVQVVCGFCRWSGTDIPGKRSFDSLDVSHAPSELPYTDYFSAQLLTSENVFSVWRKPVFNTFSGVARGGSRDSCPLVKLNINMKFLWRCMS